MTNRAMRILSTSSTPRRKVLGRVLAVLTLFGASLVSATVATTVATVVAPTPAAAAETGPTVTVTGRGWGHGRGMGQYGAYGYAKDDGWSSAQILDHYYGGTVAGAIPAGTSINPAAVRVELREERDRPLTVGLASGAIWIVSEADELLGSVDAGYVRLTHTTEGYSLESGTSCGGPWTPAAAYPNSTVRLVPVTSATGASGSLHLCEENAVTWYGGEIRAVYSGGVSRAVNVVALETYLRGVVPREIPSSWSQAALEVQAVAARSYMMAGDTRQQPYADSCNTTLCQVYDGLYQGPNAASPTAVTRSTTDAAIASTANMVRLKNGAIARTEFSSSTGGHTVGGTFTAVVDAGDDVSANPNHTWSTVVDLTALESAYNLGRLRSITVTERNGLGADGGRAETVRLDFELGFVNRTGDSIRSALGLKSTWVSFGAVVRPVSESNQRFISSAYTVFYGRAATTDETAYWGAQIEVGSRSSLISALVNSDPWTGAQVDDLYRRALGRAADAEGRAYWVSILSGKTRLEFIGVQFYGSREYFLRSGGTNEAFVAQLYRDVMLREPDQDGLNYWVSQMNRGAGYDVIAASFYYSVESRRTRAANLFVDVLGRTASEAEIAQRADDLLRIDDLDLAVVFGSSDEFYSKAQG